MKNKFLSLLYLFMMLSTVTYSHEKLVIFGSGAAGLTSAIYAAQAKLAPLVLEGEICEGQLASVFTMENFPGFPEGITGEELLLRLNQQANKFGARFEKRAVAKVDLSQRPFKITLQDDQTIFTDALLIASGSSKRWLGLQSEEALKGKGVATSAACEASLFQGKEVAVIGGGDAACEEALALSAYATTVWLVHRSAQLSASEYLKDKIAASPNIQLLLDSKVEEILDVSFGKVTGIVVKNLKDAKVVTLSCEGVFVSIGRVANTELFKGQLELTSSGLISVQSGCTKTSIPGVFAAGDICDPTYRKAITAASMGCMAAIDAIDWLANSVGR